MSQPPAPELRQFVRPGAGSGLLDVFRRRYLLSLIVKKDVQVRYRGSLLGWLWSYVKPSAQFVVFFLALGVFLRLNDTIPNYPIYLFSGMILVNFFNEGFGNATKALVDNGALIKKIYLPRELFPVSTIFIALINFLPQVIILIIVALFVGWHPDPLQLLGAVLAIIILMTLALGLGMLFGAVNVSFRDSQNIVDLVIMMVTWASPVLYQWQMVADIVPDWLFTIYQLNPITAAVGLFHQAFWYPTTDGSSMLQPHLWLFALCALVVSLIVLALGQLVFRKLEGRFAQDL